MTNALLVLPSLVLLSALEQFAEPKQQCMVVIGHLAGQPFSRSRLDNNCSMMHCKWPSSDCVSLLHILVEAKVVAAVQSKPSQPHVASLACCLVAIALTCTPTARSNCLQGRLSDRKVELESNKVQSCLKHGCMAVKTPLSTQHPSACLQPPTSSLSPAPPLA